MNFASEIHSRRTKLFCFFHIRACPSLRSGRYVQGSLALILPLRSSTRRRQACDAPFPALTLCNSQNDKIAPETILHLQKIKKSVNIKSMYKIFFKNAFSFFLAALIAMILFSCNSVPDEIPEDLDASQLIQLGQDNYDAGKYAASEMYFNAVLERYGTDVKRYVEAKYELGHLFIKTKKYQSAYNNFKEILEIYENVPVGLSGSYKRLSQLELEKIPQKDLDEIEAKKAARKADLAAEAEKVKAEEAAKKAKEEEESRALEEASQTEELPEETD